MLYRILSLIIVLGLLQFSCVNRYKKKYKDIIELAPQNSEEILKILKHYSSEEDSLKLKAAIFLIKNSIYHSGSFIEYPTFIDKHYLKEDSVINQKSHYDRIKKEAYFQKYKNATLIKLNSKSDINDITSKLIINRIDYAFQVWDHSEFNSTSFQNFCEYILPYRVLNEPITLRLPFIATRIKELFYDTIDHNNIIKNISLVQNYLKLFKVHRQKNFLPDWGVWNFVNYQNYKCIEKATSNCQILRYAGIACAIDFVPQWMDRASRHYWLSFPEYKDSTLCIDGIETKFSPRFIYDKIPKVFRYTFSANSDSPYMNKGPNEQLPAIFNSPYIIDVSNQYIQTQDIDVDIYEFPENNNIAYFCIPINQDFYPVAYSVLSKERNRVSFKAIRDDIVGIPCYFDGYKMIPVNNMYQYKKGKKPHEIKIHPNQYHDITVYNKFPIKKRMKEFAYNLLGSKIEASNDSLFNKKEVLYNLKDTTQIKVYTINVNPTKPYKYYRIITDTTSKSKIYLSEIEFYSTDQDSRKEHFLNYSTNPKEINRYNFTDQKYYKEVGEAIGLSKTKGFGNLSNAFDLDLETYADLIYIGNKFEKPIIINQIRFMPRNANNSINIGDKYQLYYWDFGWKHAGKQEAKYPFIRFKNIPKGTIYWLRNLSKGKEELPFIINDGKQYFINHDNTYNFLSHN